MVRCSQCLAFEDITRARYRFVELPLALLLLRPFHCDRCIRRFWGCCLRKLLDD